MATKKELFGALSLRSSVTEVGRY